MQALHYLEDAIDVLWDADDSMDKEYCLSTPAGKYVTAIHPSNSKSLEWLCFFISRKVLKCWNNEELQELIKSIEDYLFEEKLYILNMKHYEVSSPYHDCRYSETQSAADSITNAVRYIQTKNPIFAIYCISDADCAFDHALIEEKFREWLIKQAIPHSFAYKDSDSLNR